jgi:hypothetical protein
MATLLGTDGNQLNWGDLVRDEVTHDMSKRAKEYELLDQTSKDGINLMFKKVRGRLYIFRVPVKHGSKAERWGFMSECVEGRDSTGCETDRVWARAQFSHSSLAQSRCPTFLAAMLELEWAST